MGVFSHAQGSGSLSIEQPMSENDYKCYYPKGE
jgi:hypothetical protein